MTYIFKNKIVLPILAAIIFIGCGYKETNTQIRDLAYLKFTKSLHANYTIVINEKYEFSLNSCVPNKDTGHCYDDTVNKVFEVSSGNNVVKAYDSNKNLILRKEVYMGSNNTVEINLP